MKNKSLENNEKKQKDYYNRIAEKYDKHFSNLYALKYRYNLYDRIFKNIDLRELKILDAMCGGGEATGYFLHHGSNVAGLDISEKCCEIYAARYKPCEIVCSSILQTCFPDSYFDVVITDSLHHLHPEIKRGITEIHRIMKPNALFCCWEPNARSFLNIVRKTWYKLDPNYFQNNEKAIDIEKLKRDHETRFEKIREIYGGNLAYIFVNLSMIMRIPEYYVKQFATLFISVENFINKIYANFISLWVICLLRKKDVT
jgi:ubiquinone/menaquinone biosynthesis C-methylase UbiE